MPRLTAVLLALLAVAPLAAQDAASIARRVHDERIDPAALIAALRSTDPLARATAARVALVRNVTESVPALREMLAKEPHPEAAREQMRALVLLGSDDDVAFAAQQLGRYPKSIDGEFGEAISRHGGQRALDLYFRHARGLRMAAFDLTLMFRGHEPLLATAASRALEAKDEPFWRGLLGRIAADDLALPDERLVAAVRSDHGAIRIATLWHLLERADDAPPLAAAIREAATQPREGASIEEAFARELLRRRSGEAARKVAGAAAWIAVDDNRRRVSITRIERLLTAAERKALPRPDKRIMTIPQDNPHTATVKAPAFLLPIGLPAGAGDAIVRASGCRGGWFGVGSVSVDRFGRVTTLDLANVKAAEPGCLDALATAARLTLAEPLSVRSGDTAPVIFVRHASQPPCFDQAALAAAAVPAAAARVGGEIRAPTAVRRVEPDFPHSVIQAVGPGQSIPLIIESIISSTGCLRSFRMVRQSHYPELNRAALDALSKWKFEPGVLNGVPLDVVFHLTINFRSR